MKKLFCILIMVLCLLITGCGNDKTRTVKTLDDFGNSATNEGFSVKDNMISYVNVDYILESRVATYDDIEIEMIKYSNSDYAMQVQEQQIESFNLLKSTGAFVEKEKGSNYYEYVLVSNNRYMVSTRIDDTLIFSKVMLTDREIVEKIIDSLGY